VLGERQDAVIAADELRRVGLRAHAAGENAFTYGLLVGSQRQQGRAVEAQVTTLLDALDDPRLRLRR
jgi:hypothetical protein